MKVKVVAHRGLLVMMPDKPEEGIGNEWWPTGQGRLGCVVGNTKTNLGVSRKALDLMKAVKRNHDAIGDLGWWKCDDGTYAFSWFGSLFRVVNPKTSEAARDFQVYPDQCTVIPNVVPIDVQEAVDQAPTLPWWGLPRAIEAK